MVRHDTVIYTLSQSMDQTTLLSNIAIYFVLSVAAVKYAGTHNHAPDEASVQRGLLLKQMQSKVQRNPSMPVGRIYDKCASEIDNDDYIPDFLNVRTRI